MRVTGRPGSGWQSTDPDGIDAQPVRSCELRSLQWFQRPAVAGAIGQQHQNPARGRPFPHMVLRNMLELDISPVQSVVKVDDTLTGIEEGLNAGSWAIGLAISGNEVGVQLDEWNAFSEELKQRHRDRIYPTMYQRGAHDVVDSIADLVPCLDDIELRLKRGEKP